MLKFFKKQRPAVQLPFFVDLHSHLLPGLDDGVKSFEESIYILRALSKLGYKKVITTPHVMSDHYPNTRQSISMKFAELRDVVEEEELEISLDVAAEYYLDENFMDQLSEGEELLTLHQNYVLFETSFLNKPTFLEEAIFKINSNGYIPVLAHPERYSYIISNPSYIKRLKNMNVLFQVNLLSIFGFYSSSVKKMALTLIKSGMVDFFGTDCHNAYQIDHLSKSITNRNLRLFNSTKVLNSQLQ